MTAASRERRDTGRTMAGYLKAERAYVTMRGALYAYKRYVMLGHWLWEGPYSSFHSEQIRTTGWLWASSRGVQDTNLRRRKWSYVF